MGIREEFYDGLRQDYVELGKSSYLYRYFQNRPRKRRGGGEAEGIGVPDDAQIRQDIKTFFYDVRHGRKKDATLSMLEEFCARRGVTSLLTGGGERTAPAEVEELDAFCRGLMKSGDDQVRRMLIPLRIDPATGAGLYLVGADLLEDAELSVKGACCYLCLWTEELMLYQDVDEDDVQYLWSLGYTSRERVAEQYGYPSLAEAITWFDRLTNMNGEAYRTFIDNNGPPPAGCPAALLRYFEPSERAAQPSVPELIARGRSSFQGGI